MRVAPVIDLNEVGRRKLEKLSKARSSSIRVTERAKIVLLAADGVLNCDIAERTGTDAGKVGRWRKRYAAQGLPGILKDKTRPGRIPAISAALRSRIIRKTLRETPDGATHWRQASMASEVGVSPATVGRIWSANGLKPHGVKSFKLSNDKRFEEKLEDIVGLYLSPPEHAIVLSCDEPSGAR